MDFLSHTTADDVLGVPVSPAHGAQPGPLVRLAYGEPGSPATEHEGGDHLPAQHLLDVEATTPSRRPVASPRDGVAQPRLHRGVVLRVQEDSCEVLVEGRSVVARYTSAFPRPRTERVAPGHLVALATAADASAVVVFRWYDAVVLAASGEQVQMWEPAHGEVLATPRHPGRHHHQRGTRAYLSGGLPGAQWWLAGPVIAATNEADVELAEVERFCTEHDLWDQPT